MDKTRGGQGVAAVDFYPPSESSAKAEKKDQETVLTLPSYGKVRLRPREEDDYPAGSKPKKNVNS